MVIKTHHSVHAKSIGLLMIPGFPMLSYASLIEGLRAANILSGRELYHFKHISPPGQEAVSSTGTVLQSHCKVTDDINVDAVLVCAGGKPESYRNSEVNGWLRYLAQKGVVIGGISGGTYILARAGVMQGYRCTIHWDHLPLFREEFPSIDVRKTLYEIDRDRWTCAGGIAALDLICAIVQKDHGEKLAIAVGDWLLQTKMRTGTQPQRMSVVHRYQIKHPKLVQALELIEGHVDDTISRSEISDILQISVRQIERLFREHLGCSLRTFYMDLRLAQACQLLTNTSMPLSDIAAATGFPNSSSLSRAFKSKFEYSPNSLRKSQAQQKGRAG